jgi:hypothetical protein
MRRILLTTLLIILLVNPIFAFEGFTDIFGEDSFEETTVQVSSDDSGVKFNGALSFSIQGIKDKDNSREINTTINGGLMMDLGWKGSIVDAKVTLDLLPKTDRTQLEWVDIFKILSISTFFDGGYVEAGLLKKEWGSGDGVHVVDVLNAPDYRNGISDDPLEMKMSEPMIVASARFKDTTVEAVYKPMLIPMVAASLDSGSRWMMPNTIGAITIPGMPPIDEAFMARVKVEEPSPDELSTLNNSQWGIRLKTIFGPIDAGIIYYNGFYPTPSFIVDMTKFIEPEGDINVTLEFTHAQLFGTEATVVVGPLTFMLEGGFWLSEDYKGAKPNRYNNKAVYLAGVGFTIPKTSAYMSFTYNGEYIMNFPDSPIIYGAGPGGMIIPIEIDADGMQSLVSSNGKAYMNTLTAAFELPLARERVNLRLAGTYQVETKGYLVMPSVSWSVVDELLVKAAGRFYGTFDEAIGSMFNTWKDNSTLTVGISYLF